MIVILIMMRGFAHPDNSEGSQDADDLDGRDWRGGGVTDLYHEPMMLTWGGGFVPRIHDVDLSRRRIICAVFFSQIDGFEPRRLTRITRKARRMRMILTAGI